MAERIPIPTGLQGAAFLTAVNAALQAARTSYRDDGPDEGGGEVGEMHYSTGSLAQWQRLADGDLWHKLWSNGIGPLAITPYGIVQADTTIDAASVEVSDADLRSDAASWLQAPASYYPIDCGDGDVVLAFSDNVGPGGLHICHRVGSTPANSCLALGRYLSPGDWLLALRVPSGGAWASGTELVYLREPVASVFEVGSVTELEVSLFHTTVHFIGTENARMPTYAEGTYGGRLWHFKNTTGSTRYVYVQTGDDMNGTTNGNVALASGESCSVYAHNGGWFSR